MKKPAGLCLAFAGAIALAGTAQATGAIDISNQVAPGPPAEVVILPEVEVTGSSYGSAWLNNWGAGGGWFDAPSNGHGNEGPSPTRRPEKPAEPPAPPAPRDPGDDEKEEPASDDNTAIESCGKSGPSASPVTGRPVIIATGEKYKVEPDFGAGSSYGLGHSRTYRSYTAKATMFGQKWMSGYDYPTVVRLGCFRHPDYGSLCIPNTIVFTLPDDATHSFNRDTGALNQFRYYAVNSAASLGPSPGTHTATSSCAPTRRPTPSPAPAGFSRWSPMAARPSCSSSTRQHR